MTTKYYRATWALPAGKTSSEVFISESLEAARKYADGKNPGRQLIALTEHPDLYSAMMEEPGDTTNKQL